MISARHLLLAFSLLLPLLAQATHNRAGEIIVDQVGECGQSLEICATIITYSTFPSEADRDSLELFWDDGTSTVVDRTLIRDLGNGIRRNEYRACHVYAGFGVYTLSFEDPNRIENIINIPNSVGVVFSLFTTYTLANPVLSGCNSSPRLAQEPLDEACIGEIFTHNPAAFDPDGDSLVFEFTTPRMGFGQPVSGYVYPDQIGPPAGNDITIDRQTGQIEWNRPAVDGEYNLAFLIISFRNGQPIDTMIRDMQILVRDCENAPPTVDVAVEEICVVAGEVVEFTVTAGAPITDLAQLVQLTATGGPFLVPVSQATFLPENLDFNADPFTRTFRWQTTCDHISSQPYFVVFKAEDNFFGNGNGLSTLKTVSIKVVGPPPEDVQAVSEDEAVNVSWEMPYRCEEQPPGFFFGFSVWRREGSNNFVPDTCETGLAGRGYTQLLFTETPEFMDGRYVYFDNDVERGRTYCYRILAHFVRRTVTGGLIYEEILSIPSREACVQLDRDIPLLTKVDVLITDPLDGSIEVCWTKPDPTSLDTIGNPGPYRYVLSRAPGQTTNPAEFSPLGVEFTVQNFSDPVDTCYTDTGLNTDGLAYSYLIDFFANDDTEPFGAAQPASSVFLTTSPTDRAVDLTWTETVPWDNFEYTVFRRNPGATVFDSVTTVTAQTYRDTGLVNGDEYCYYILARGTYGVEGIASPLLNRSQQTCEVPFDNVPPCPPVLTVSSVCDRGIDCSNADQLFNTLIWDDPGTRCPGSEDVAGYRIFFSPSTGTPRELVAVIEDGRLLTFDHSPPDGGIVGCYAVTALDDNGNESAESNVVCVDNCPFYELPNVFTPNGDSQNDFYIPRDFCFIERVDFEVYNRWGQVVFRTEDPALNWDGTNLNGDELESATYFYRCQVFERRVDGIVALPDILSGAIELIRGE
ncbi:MAG: gliding motility-associated C-terminal domain-containing protein [Saprospiraceae bacterium]